MKLIAESIEHVEYLSEASENGKREHYITGIFMQGDIKNRNGRIYPMKVLESAVDKYVHDIVDQKRAYGELGHPAGPQINLDRVSHLITELKKDGKKPNFIGKAKITDTPMGKIAKGLLEAGSNLGVSCRGLGSLKNGKDGAMEVQPDYKIATAADIVADPSAPNAFVEGIMEGVEWIYDPVKGLWQEEKLHGMRKEVHAMSKSQLEERRLAMFEEYMTALTIKSKLL